MLMAEKDGWTAGRVNFDYDGRCLGLCFNRNESACVSGKQLYEAAQKISRGQPLTRTRMGGTVKTSNSIPGVEVFRTQAGGILEKLGIQTGDTITSLNGIKVKNSANFFQAIGYTAPENINLTISREGKEHNFSM